MIVIVPVSGYRTRQSKAYSIFVQISLFLTAVDVATSMLVLVTLFVLHLASPVILVLDALTVRGSLVHLDIRPPCEVDNISSNIC